VVLSALHLDGLVNSLSADALARSETVSQQVNTFVTDHINQHSAELLKTPTGIEETKSLWSDIVATDPDISSTLVKMLARSSAIVEINIVGQSGQILASSDPSRVGGTPAPLEEFSKWRTDPLYRRLVDLLARRPDYQVTVPLGQVAVPLGAAQSPIFTIQVVISSVLISTDLLPEVKTLAVVSGGALLVSVLLTVLVSNRALRPLRRIEQTIDRIVQGKYRSEESDGRLTKEFAVVESKLNLLGQQFRGAREDATELQNNIDQLLERMASQLDVASRLTAINRITGGVAHEIKNPLNAISLRLDLLRARLGAPEDELAGEIDVLTNEVRRLDRVVKTFLDFSRPVEMKVQDVDLAILASEVADLLAPQARLAGITLEFQGPAGGESMHIRGDADMLKQAILNLVTNAIDAMKSGGNLKLRASRAGDAVTLEVADNGPGIPPNLRNKVFQLYFTTKAKGSGIGLAMTYRTVQLHNGTIDFTSEEGRGTTFRLQFPATLSHA
jgi:signal transduction histidine kinase